jgi:hypothetical protein
VVFNPSIQRRSRSDKILAYKTVANPDLFNLQASIINGARGQVFQPPFNCPEPATECRWKDIRTLGICRDIKDVSNTTTYKCSGSTTLLLNCTYSIPDRIDEDTEPIIVSYSQDANVQNIPKTTLFRSLPGSGQEVGSLATVRVTNPERGLPKVETTPPATEIFYTTFYWCEKVFHNITASSGNLHINEDPTGKRLNVAGGITDIVTIDGHKNLDNKMNAAYFSLPSNETNIIYNISRSTVSFIFNYMTILFDTTALQTSENRGAPDRSIIDLAQYFLFHNISDITQNVSDSLTNQLRGGRTQTLQDLGDNANATTSSGEAYWNETYVKVRWAWLIIPLLETVLVSILLVVTIVVTWNEVLFKTSVAALFVHGLDGWREDEVEVGEPETAEKLEKRMEGMVAGFERDGGGVLKFVRA